VNHVLKGKLLESPTLMQQAQANTKKQFEESPNLDQEILYAAMDSDSAFSAMTRQALESEKIRQRLKEILLSPAALYEALRKKGQAPSEHPTA
jgi:type I restriction enzyme R subunit